GQTLALALLLLALGLGLAESILRIPAVQAVLPPPSTGTGLAQFEVKRQILLEYIETGAPINCVAIGSSMVDSGFNPQALAEGYVQAAGSTLKCFNFGVQGITGAEAGGVFRLMQDAAYPDVLIYGVSARDLAEYNGPQIDLVTRAFQANPWIRYRLGIFSVPGWLTDHSAAYGYYLTARAMLSADEWNARMSSFDATRADGFRVAPLSNNAGPDAPTEFVPEVTGPLVDYHPSPTRLAGLDEVLNLQTEGVTVVIVEMPLPDAT
ncbi:MAG: hypothetical protein IT326_07610, partial [Anaerolineae bacterium]|nr:hypothetical protein [Anaerolineae bacterium]